MKDKKISNFEHLRLAKNNFRNIKAGGIYKIIDDCNGNHGYYFWDSETGDCWDILGNKMYTC